MANISLYINGKQADLNGAESAIAITYRFSDLSNPDQITDSFSKTLTLPGTKANNAIFAQGWNLTFDMVPLFNASQRNSFELYVNSSLLHSGYIKLNKITLNNKVYSYDVTLYGDVTLYMNALDEISFKDGIRYRYPQGVSHLLTPDYVSESWNDGAHYAKPITYVPCNNGYYENFDNKKELQYDNGSYAIGTSKYWVGSNTYEFESNEWQRREFRVTKQRPAMQVFEVISSACHPYLNDISTGNGMISSVDGWFSDSFYDENPYCQSSVMTFPLIEFPEETNIQDSATIEGSFAKIYNGARYNTIALHVANNDPAGVAYDISSTSHESLSAIPYGRGIYKTFDVDMTPAVDVAGIFNGTDTADLSQYALLLEPDTVYGCTFRIEYLMGLRVDPLSNRNWIFAGFNGGPTGTNCTPINFMAYTPSTYGQFGSGMVKVIPQLVVTWNNTEHIYTMNPYFNSISYTNDSTVWGNRGNSNGSTMTGHDVFTKYGAQCGTNEWMNTTGMTHSDDNSFVLFPDITNSYLLGYTGETGDWMPYNVPWQFFNNGYYVSETAIDAEDPTRRFTLNSQSHGNTKFPYRPQQWRYHLSLSGEMLKTASFKIRFTVYKPRYICIPASGSIAINNARERINALVDPSDRLVEAGLYNISYDMDILLTSMTRTALPGAVNQNSGSQSVTYYQNNGNTSSAVHNLSTADFKIKDIVLDGLVPPDGYIVTDDMILDAEVTCKDILTSFTKMFGLIYDTMKTRETVNGVLYPVTKTIIKTRNEYFSNYTIKDWSDKVDWSQTVEIEPVTMSSKWLSLKLNSSDTYYEKKYDNKYGFEYGEARVNTGYQFNTDTEELLKDNIFNNTVVSTEFNWFYPTSGQKFIRESVTLPPCPAYFDKDNGEYKSVDTKFNFLFDNDLLIGNNEGSGGSQYGGRYYITQDSSLMYSLEGGGKACWYSPSTLSAAHSPGIIIRGQYRYYSTFMDSDPYYGAPFSWDFSKPQENYQGITDDMYPQNCTIYGRYWRRYIEEIYNVKNKKVTMYIYLTPEDMVNFSFKDFVKIDGVLYHVNQITDYSPAKIKPVQVELITVQDINAYTDGQDIWGQPVDTGYDAAEKAKSRSKLRKASTQDSSSNV